MKKITRMKQVVNKLGSLPCGSMVQLSTYYSSFKGYLHILPESTRNKGSLGGKYMLATDDQKYMNVTEYGVNVTTDDQQNKRRVEGKIRLTLENRGSDWYPIEWKSGVLFYQYKETDFIDSEFEYKEKMMITVEAHDDSTDMYSTEVVLTRDNAMVVEVNGCLITFVVENATVVGIVSQCGEYFLSNDGGEFTRDGVTPSEAMKLVGL